MRHPAAAPRPPPWRSSLLDYVRERKRLPEPEAVLIFQQLLHALQFCHRKDVSGGGMGGSWAWPTGSECTAFAASVACSAVPLPRPWAQQLLR